MAFSSEVRLISIPPREKVTARQDQAGQGTSDGTRGARWWCRISLPVPHALVSCPTWGRLPFERGPPKSPSGQMG